MAKVIPIELVKGYSGKVCQHSDTSFAYNASSGTCNTQKRCNPYTGDPTDDQKVQQKVFAARQGVVLQWLRSTGTVTVNLFMGEKCRNTKTLAYLHRRVVVRICKCG